jgi:regulation of enolase protein 1 (concanavalin A-like superfamily)
MSYFPVVQTPSGGGSGTTAGSGLSNPITTGTVNAGAAAGVTACIVIAMVLATIVVLSVLGADGDLTPGSNNSPATSSSIVSLTNWATTAFGTVYSGGYTQLLPNAFVVNGSGSEFFASTSTYAGQALYQNVSGSFIFSCVLLIDKYMPSGTQVGAFVTPSLQGMSSTKTIGIDIVNTSSAVKLETNENVYASISASIGQAYVAVIIERIDTTITVQYSFDGITYTLVTPEGVLIAGNASVGMFVTSNNDGVYSLGVFYNVSLLVSELTYSDAYLPLATWQVQPFGTIYGGTVTQNNATTFTISGSGEDVNVAGNIYAGQAAFQIQTGNFSLTTLVLNASTATNAKVGILVTSNLQAMLRTNTVIIYIQYSGSAYALDAGNPGFVSIGALSSGLQWFTASRNGTVVTLSYSTDGVTYTALAASGIVFSGNCTVGLFVTSADDGLFVNGYFYDVIVT